MCDDRKHPESPPEPKAKPERDVDDLIFRGQQERQISDR